MERKNIIKTCGLLVAACIMHTSAMADNEDKTITLGDVNIIGTRAPLPADKAVRLVQVVSRKEIEASSAQSVNDLLKLVAGVDVRQRGACGVQTDVGINGSTCNQVTVLLNGVNITNPHTGHLTIDLPVSTDDIERIEVIDGGASRIYGANAFAGAINIVTRKPVGNSLEANLQGGSFGSAAGTMNMSTYCGKWQNYVAGGYSRSDGGTENSDFKKGHAYWNGSFTGKQININTQLGMSHMDYGANTFYGTGSHSQYEDDSRYLISVNAEPKGQVIIKPQIYWNRSIDHYVWTRSNPSAYENFHQTNVYGASLGAHTTWSLGSSAVGLEMRHEEIFSTRLGQEVADAKSHKVPGHDAYYKYQDNRTNYSLYAEHDIIVDNVSISLGLIANKNTAVDGSMSIYPGIDLSWQPASGLRLYTSYNQSLRMPTFTELYYNGPGMKGNSSLLPEKSQDYAIGASYANNIIKAQIKGFFRHGTDMIDWSKQTGDNYWSTGNSDIDYIGVEALTAIRFTSLWGNESWLQNAILTYCYVHEQRVNAEESARFESGLNYLRNKFVASLTHRIFSRLTASWSYTLRNRNGEFDNATTGELQKYGTSSQIDLKLQWTGPRYTLYLQGSNLLSERYYDVANVPQPGFWFMGGIKIRLEL